MKRTYLTCLVSLLCLNSSIVLAFNQQDLDKLLSTNSCENCDISSAVIKNKKFIGANLKGANLEAANFHLVSLGSANLEGANMKNMILSKGNLSQANLKNANLQKSKISAYAVLANFEGANLQGAVLKGSVLEGANIAGTHLNNAVLDEVRWIDGKVCSAGSVGRCIPKEAKGPQLPTSKNGKIFIK